MYSSSFNLLSFISPLLFLLLISISIITRTSHMDSLKISNLHSSESFEVIVLSSFIFFDYFLVSLSPTSN
uniref:Uncharacterized protein n=1 Tax=Solanum lycopersicum TaxID=4081 RepID=A0A3Q7HAM3_SOLLC